MKLKKLKPWEVNLNEAIDTAIRAASNYGIPQTVYRSNDTCGWANTNCLAPCLNGADLHITALPENFFN